MIESACEYIFTLLLKLVRISRMCDHDKNAEILFLGNHDLPQKLIQLLS
jgi:hypothetical protein